MVKKKTGAGKIIKKTGKVFAWIFGVLLLLCIVAFIAIRSPAAQTWMAQRAAAYLSDELNTKITIRAVKIEFFKTINLEGIYAEDLHGDTLLYADELAVVIDRFNYDNKYLSIKSITLSDSKIKLKKYAGEKGLSYRFIAQYFKKGDTTATPSAPWKVEVGGVELDNVVFAYMDTRDTINDPGMDYENIRVTGIKALVYDIDPMDDSLSLRIKNLQGLERCGFALKDFSTRMTVSDSVARLDNLHFITKGSTVDGFIAFYFNSTDDIADDFIHLVKMDGHFSSSIIEMGDIAYFAPELLGIKKKILLTGDIKGTVEHLKCKNVDIRFGEISHIAGNFSFNGLPDITQTDMNFKIREAVTNRKDLEGIPLAPFEQGKHLVIDDAIGRLGTMVFSGSFEGFLNDFVAHGKLNTALGSLQLQNLVMARDNDSAEYSYVGDVHANHFNIGSYFDIPDLSYVTGDVNINGSGLGKNTINAKIDGQFSELVYHGYAYRGISITNGKFRRQVFDGDFNLDDPNVTMVFNGSIDNSGAIPQMNFTAKIDSADLGQLGFTDKTHENILSADLSMNFKGGNIDNIDGTFRVNNLNYSKDGEKFRFNELLLVAGPAGNGSRTIFLESDIVTVTLSGKFRLMELPHTASDMMSAYLPAYFPPDDPKEARKHVAQDFTWNINFHTNTQPIKALVPNLEIGPNTLFKGRISSEQHEFNTYFQSPYIVYNHIQYRGLEITTNSRSGNQLALAGTMDELRLTDTISTRNIRLNSIAANDSIQTHLEWNNRGAKKNSANINAVVLFESQKSFQVNFRETEFNVNDSTWKVAGNNFVRLDSGKLSFHELVFASGDASLGLNGVVSKNPTDELKISLKEFNIAYLNYFAVPLGITLKGYISSESGISDVYETPIFTSNSTFKDFWINGQKLGDGVVDASWLKSKQAVYINGYFSRGVIAVETGLPINNVALEGFYYPKNKENALDINATFINIPLATLQPLLKDFCSVMVGQIDGGLHIGGTFAKPSIEGDMDVIMKMVRVDYLGLALRSNSQKIKIENNSFFFDDYKVMDENGNIAKIYGHLYHDNFTKFQFDMDFGFDHFMVLNTNANMNEAFYGRVFASGYMNVFGYVDDIIHLEMNAKTEKIYKGGQPVLSEFSIPMISGNSEIGTSDFIYFETPDKPTDKTEQKKSRSSGLDIVMEIEATEDAIVKVIFDKTVGDELTAYGRGNLTLKIPPSGDMSIRGQYQVAKGNYLFTMKNVVLVPFELADGGVISWNGDPSDAQINADAVYKTTASVETFFPTADSTNAAYHRSYPVEVVMHLSNNLMNPDVAFDINLPTADQNIQETVRSYTQTDLERNRQVLSLMVLNSFMTPSEFRDGAGGTNYAGDATSTLLSNFVSGTLNNWLSQISSDFNMGVKYRQNDDLTAPDLKVFLSTQLLNNRITIDGNVGKVNANQVTTTTGTNSQWVGDVNVEYKVTDDGKVRLRAFNRSNDNALLTNSSPYTQGVGVFYKEEFDTWEQFFRSKRKKKAAEEQEKVNTKAPAEKPAVADSSAVQ